MPATSSANDARVLVGRAAVERARGRGSPCRPRSSGTSRGRGRREAPSRSSATSTVCAYGTSGVGSRSKSTKSGRSGCRPASTTGSCRCSPCSPSRAARARRRRPGSRPPLLVRRASRPSVRNVSDPVRHVRGRVLLEERLAEGAVGVAAHRERPAPRDEARAPAPPAGSSRARSPFVIPSSGQKGLSRFESRARASASRTDRPPPGRSCRTSAAGLSSRRPL